LTKTATDPKASVIVPCGRPERAEGTLCSLTRQKCNYTFEVIVVGKGVERLKSRFPAVRKIEAAARLTPAQARNRGAKEARGEFLLFLDDDCEASTDWVEQNIAVLRSFPGLGAVSGRIRSKTRTYAARCLDFTNFGTQQSPKRKVVIVGLCSASMAISRELFEKLNGFDEQLIIREDMDLVVRAGRIGRTSAYDPSITILHNHGRDTLAKLLAYHYRNGLSAGLVEESKNLDIPANRLRWRFRHSYSVLVLPLALLETAHSFIINFPSEPAIIIMLPALFLAFASHHLGVARALKCR
jgi:GT2 family glycosyltransferase